MASTPVHRLAAETEDKSALTLQIFNQLYGLYNDPQKYTKRTEFGTTGLLSISRVADVQPELLTPRRRVTVLIIGNHSAGKSSFINHYVEERVQRTGVAVESTGFTIIRAGKQEQDVAGEGALVDNEHIAAVAGRLGPDRQHFIENLSLCVRASGAKDFANVDFIDTPGLCDGEIKYPFDVNKCICELASVADLILVFLDPVGKAQVSRTLEVVETLSRRLGYYDRMRIYLTKADTAETPQDLVKVIAQISINLYSRLYNTHGLEIPAMWIPPNSAETAQMLAARGFLENHNAIHRLVADIKKTINTKIQANMTTCLKDCTRVVDRIDALLLENTRRELVKHAWRRNVWLMMPMFLIILLVSFLDVLVAAKEWLPNVVAEAALGGIFEIAQPFVHSLDTTARLVGIVGLNQRLLAFVVLFAIVTVLVKFFQCRIRLLRTRTDPEIKQLQTYQDSAETMHKYVQDLYQRYVRAVQNPDYDQAQAQAALGTPAGNGKARR